MLRINDFSGLCGYVRGVLATIQVRYPLGRGNFDDVEYYTRKEAVTRNLLQVGERESVADLVISRIPWAEEADGSCPIHTETLDKALKLVGYRLVRDTTLSTVLAVEPANPLDRVGYRIAVQHHPSLKKANNYVWVGREYNSDEYAQLLDAYDLVCSALGAFKVWESGNCCDNFVVRTAVVTSEIDGSDEVEFVPVSSFQRRLAALEKCKQEGERDDSRVCIPGSKGCLRVADV